LIVQEFMNATRTQLTHYGLHELQETLPEGHLCAFFRNNHFCTLFKNPMDGVLYTLVTDQSLAHEQSIVWESLLDVDGAGDFLDGLFRHGALEVGDYARHNQPIEQQHHLGDGGGDEDFALALQLQQQEEEEEARRTGKRVSTSQLGLGNQSGQHYLSGSGSSSSGHGHSQQQQQQQQQQELQLLQQQQLQVQQQQPHQRQFGYETDEEMAARLHQEFMASDQRELQQQQRQQQQQQQRNSQQGRSSYDQGPYPSTSTSPYDPYAQGRPGVPQAQVQAYRPPQGQPQNQGQPQDQGHGRIRNSSETSSDKKDKDKCIIS
ncbi:Ubiquitin carboxyl-terminal hydrolase MINDY-2, partial [Podila verticillata]